MSKLFVVYLLIGASIAFAGNGSSNKCPFLDKQPPKVVTIPNEHALLVVLEVIAGTPNPNHPYTRAVQSILDHARQSLEQRTRYIRELIHHEKPLPEEILRLPEVRVLQQRSWAWDLDATVDVNRYLMEVPEMQLLLAWDPLTFIEFKVHGTLRSDLPVSDISAGIPAVGSFGSSKSKFESLFTAEQTLFDLIRGSRQYREYERHKILQGAGKHQTLLWSYTDKRDWPKELHGMDTISFSTKTVHHSFPHFSNGLDPQESIDDLLLLSRRNRTSIVVRRLTIHDVIFYLTKQYFLGKGVIPLRLDHQGFEKNKLRGRMIAPFRLSIPSSIDGKSEPIELGVIVCATTECETKGVKFHLGEVISVCPISGFGVVRIPPRNEIYRHHQQGLTPKQILNPSVINEELALEIAD